MKNIISSMIIILSLWSITGLAGDIELPHITVFGTAVTEVTPDKMIWRAQVINKKQSLDETAKEHIEVIKEVTAFLKGSGISEEKLQTSRMELGENWEYKNRSNIQEGYYAKTLLVFSTTDLNKYEEIWRGLSHIKYVNISDVSYDHTNRIGIQNQTRKKAVLAAKGKAKILAETIGSDIAEPLLIEEVWPDDDIKNNQNILAREKYEGGTKGSSISPGQIPIRIRIKAAFRLITHSQ